MVKTGRKSKAEELKIVDRYAALSEEFFNVLNEHLQSKSKKDRRWAVEQLSKGFVKMIPQVSQLGGDPNNNTPIPIYNAKSVNG